MNKIMIRIEKENLLTEKTSVVEFEAPYGKGELHATLDRLRKEIFDIIEDDYAIVDYNCVGVFINGAQAHIFDKEYMGFWGCGSVPTI